MDSRRPAAVSRGRRFAFRALWIGLFTSASCVDHDVTGPVQPAITSSSVALSGPQAQLNGIECGCSKVGAFVAPALGKNISTTREGTSPGGTYQVTTTTIGSTIELRIMKGTALVAQFSGLPSTTNWGFSPDDDRFVYHYVTGSAPNQSHSVFLRNLAGSGAPLVKSFATTTGSSQVVFSPRGKHLMYSYLVGSTMTSLHIVDAVTGATRYQTSFTFQVIPGTPANKFGMASWGFGPDNSDRTFAYLYITGQSTAMWNVVNLAAAPALVLSESAAPGFWKFSPCGDVIAASRQTNASQVWVYLARTLDGSLVGNGRTLSLGTVAFRTTLADHFVTLNGVDQLPALAPNIADTGCQTPAPPPLSALSLSPTSVQGGATSTGTVTLSAAAPTGGLVVTLTSNNTSTATVPASVTVAAGNRTKTFTVQTVAVTSSRSVTISAAAAGVTKTATLSVTAPPPVTRSLSVSPTSLSFGSIPVGTTAPAQQITVTNNGNAPVTLTGFGIGSPFAYTNSCPVSPATIAVGTSCTISVMFTPWMVGSHTGALSINSDATGSPHDVWLSGSGHVPAPAITLSSTSIGFATVKLGMSPSRRVLTVTSSGTSPLVISTVTIGGANPTDFYVGNDTCWGSTLNPGSTCTVEMFFDPWAIGIRNATLTIAHNAPGGSSTVALSGLGASPGTPIP
jgi:hypothetical protein